MGLLPPRDARCGPSCRRQRREVGQPTRGLPAVSAGACLRPALAAGRVARRAARPAARAGAGEGRPRGGSDSRDCGLAVGAGRGERSALDVGLGRREEGGRPQKAPGGGLSRPCLGRGCDRGERAGPRRHGATAGEASRAALLHQARPGGPAPMPGDWSNTPFQSAPVRNNPTPRTPNAEIKVAGEGGESFRVTRSSSASSSRAGWCPFPGEVRAELLVGGFRAATASW